VKKGPETTAQRAGFVTLLGAPNAGKSTLLNRLLGEKLSIVTRKAQTTRMRVLGVLTEGEAQAALIDTPGLFQPRTRLERAMVRAAWDAIEDAEMILLVIDASARQPDPKVDAIVAELSRRERRALLILNKVDKMKVERLLPLTERLYATGVADEVMMLSALTGEGVPTLKAKILKAMPAGPWLFPKDQLTDVPERLLAAEVTREKLFEQVHDELPYGAAVVPSGWEERKDGSVSISQTIWVAKAAHRPMVLGKGGARIKAIGSAARIDMAEQLDRPVHLFLDVKVDERWQERTAFYTLFGLRE